MPEPKPLTRAERTIAARKAREAEALRQNLHKRKAQARAKPAKPEGDQKNASNA
jgi:hypothetical protein